MTSEPVSTNEQWKVPTAGLYRGELAYFGAGRIFSRVEFHVWQALAIMTALEHVRHLTCGPIKPRATEFLLRGWNAACDPQLGFAQHFNWELHQLINDFKQRSSSNEVPGRDLRTISSQFLPNETIFSCFRGAQGYDWSRKGKTPTLSDKAADLFETKLTEFCHALQEGCSKLNDLLFSAGELFESARCRRDAGDLLFIRSELCEWEANVDSESTNVMTLAGGKSLAVKWQSTELQIRSPTIKTIENIGLRLKCREPGDLRVSPGWGLAMYDILQQLRLTTNRSGPMSLQVLCVAPKSRSELDAVLAQVHSEITSLFASKPPPPNAESIPPEPAVAPSMRPSPAVVVELAKSRVSIQGVPFPVTPNQATIIQALVDADGKWISVSEIEGVRSRDLKTLPPEVRALIETKPGCGTSIPEDKLWLS